MRLVCVLFVSVVSYVQTMEQENTLRAENSQDIIPGEFIIALDETAIVHGAEIPTPRQLAEDVYSLQVKSQVRLGSILYLVVTGASADVARMGDRDDVRYTEPNQVVYATTTSMRPGTTSPVDVCAPETLSSGLWGLARIDQRESLEGIYEYISSGFDNGAGVTAYVVDSGIEISHAEFLGRASWGFTASLFFGDNDGNGHGTHVAGIIGGTTTGVAKQVSLVAVKVLGDDGIGSIGGILEALEWIVNDYNSKGRPKCVINASLGTKSTSRSLDDAVEDMVNSGIPVVAAAGNDAADACSSTPARVPSAVTVGATTQSDLIADFSNLGSCLDIFAPGMDIRSAWIGGGYNTISGTSMAAPHVAGVIARYLSTLPSRPAPAEVSDWLERTSTKGAITYGACDRPQSPNRLLYAHCYTGQGWDYDNRVECSPGSRAQAGWVQLAVVAFMGACARCFL